MSHYKCRICISEHKESIEKLTSKKVQYRIIAKEFSNSFDCDLHLLEQSIANHRKHISKELTEAEKLLLDRLAKGEATFEETSRIVTAKVFEKMLKNPDDFKFIDFFRTELLKLKQEESQIKDNWAKEIIARLFAGKLPLKDCPKCGHSLLPEDNQNLIENNSDELLN